MKEKIKEDRTDGVNHIITETDKIKKKAVFKGFNHHQNNRQQGRTKTRGKKAKEDKRKRKISCDKNTHP